MYNTVSGLGKMTLNPNASEFVPSSLKLSVASAEPSRNDRESSSRALNRTDSANSGASDDEFRQYWRNQLPDDIIPDFGMMSISTDDRPSWEHGYAEEDIKSAYFSEDQAEMASVVETEAAVDPIQLLAHEFPGFAVESLADILRANGGDLGLTIEMLIQLEIQEDAMPVRHSPSQAQIPSLTPMDFPALSGSEFRESRYGSEEVINGVQQQQQQRLSRVSQHTISVEDFFTSVPYSASGGGFRAPATDFAGAVRKNINVNEAPQWQNDRNLRVEPLLSSSSDDFGTKIGTFSSTRSSAPVWLETGEAVSSMYEEFRGEARDHARVRNAYFEQARQAYLSGNKALAKELSTKGQHHNGLMKEAHNRAGEAIFQQRNGIATSSSSSSGNHRMLDLHGLHVNEAIPLLKRQLALLRVAARASQQRQQVLICVGTGHHTKGSRTPARLPIAVEKFLVEDERLPFTEQQPGLLRVVVS